MKETKNKAIMVMTVISIILCGCPGSILLWMGATSMVDAVGRVASFSDLLINFDLSYLRGGWMICLSGILLIIPIALVMIILIQRKKKNPLTDLEPTGVSQEDPIPPTR